MMSQLRKTKMVNNEMRDYTLGAIQNAKVKGVLVGHENY